MTSEKPYRIVMERMPGRAPHGWDRGCAPLEQGYYGHVPLVGMNEYIYCRVEGREDAWTYDADGCARTIQEIWNKGYGAHAEPPLTITRSY